MSCFRKPADKIPNPRDKRRRQETPEVYQRLLLAQVQTLCFGLALLLLAAVSYGR